MSQFQPAEIEVKFRDTGMFYIEDYGTENDFVTIPDLIWHYMGCMQPISPQIVPSTREPCRLMKPVTLVDLEMLHRYVAEISLAYIMH